jgi:hypothetical protein
MVWCDSMALQQCCVNMGRLKALQRQGLNAQCYNSGLMNQLARK